MPLQGRFEVGMPHKIQYEVALASLAMIETSVIFNSNFVKHVKDCLVLVERQWAALLAAWTLAEVAILSVRRIIFDLKLIGHLRLRVVLSLAALRISCLLELFGEYSWEECSKHLAHLVSLDHLLQRIISDWLSTIWVLVLRKSARFVALSSFLNILVPSNKQVLEIVEHIHM